MHTVECKEGPCEGVLEHCMLQLGRSQRRYRSQSSVSAAFGGEEQHLHDRIEVTVNQDSPQPSLPDCSGPSSCCDKKFWYQTCFELRTRIDFDHSARAFDASDVGKEGPQLQTLFGGAAPSIMPGVQAPSMDSVMKPTEAKG